MGSIAEVVSVYGSTDGVFVNSATGRVCLIGAAFVAADERNYDLLMQDSVEAPSYNEFLHNEKYAPYREALVAAIKETGRARSSYIGEDTYIFHFNDHMMEQGDEDIILRVAKHADEIMGQ